MTNKFRPIFLVSKKYIGRYADLDISIRLGKNVVTIPQVSILPKFSSASVSFISTHNKVSTGILNFMLQSISSIESKQRRQKNLFQPVDPVTPDDQKSDILFLPRPLSPNENTN